MLLAAIDFLLLDGKKKKRANSQQGNPNLFSNPACPPHSTAAAQKTDSKLCTGFPEFKKKKRDLEIKSSPGLLNLPRHKYIRRSGSQAGTRLIPGAGDADEEQPRSIRSQTRPINAGTFPSKNPTPAALPQEQKLWTPEVPNSHAFIYLQVAAPINWSPCMEEPRRDHHLRRNKQKQSQLYLYTHTHTILFIYFKNTCSNTNFIFYQLVL